MASISASGEAAASLGAALATMRPTNAAAPSHHSRHVEAMLSRSLAPPRSFEYRGRRTGIAIKQNVRRQSNGFEDLDEFWDEAAAPTPAKAQAPAPAAPAASSPLAPPQPPSDRTVSSVERASLAAGGDDGAFDDAGEMMEPSPPHHEPGRDFGAAASHEDEPSVAAMAEAARSSLISPRAPASQMRRRDSVAPRRSRAGRRARVRIPSPSEFSERPSPRRASLAAQEARQGAAAADSPYGAGPARSMLPRRSAAAPRPGAGAGALRRNRQFFSRTPLADRAPWRALQESPTSDDGGDGDGAGAGDRTRFAPRGPGEEEVARKRRRAAGRNRFAVGLDRRDGGGGRVAVAAPSWTGGDESEDEVGAGTLAPVARRRRAVRGNDDRAVSGGAVDAGGGEGESAFDDSDGEADWESLGAATQRRGGSAAETQPAPARAATAAAAAAAAAVAAASTGVSSSQAASERGRGASDRLLDAVAAMDKEAAVPGRWGADEEESRAHVASLEERALEAQAGLSADSTGKQHTAAMRVQLERKGYAKVCVEDILNSGGVRYEQQRVVRYLTDLAHLPLYYGSDGKPSVTGAAAVDNSHITMGQVLVQPRGVYPVERVEGHGEAFVVLECEPRQLEVRIQDSEYRLAPGDMFAVPPSNAWSARNASARLPARLAFFVAKDAQ